MNKTNAVREVERTKIKYTLAEYEFVDEREMGKHVADVTNMPQEQVFKTLVAKSDKGNIVVCCIPVCCNLDLKKVAKLSGHKKLDMLPTKDLLAVTGYIRGGCTPIGMKKSYPTYIDETALLYDSIGISAGCRGLELILAPDDLVNLCNLNVGNITM